MEGGGYIHFGIVNIITINVMVGIGLLLWSGVSKWRNKQANG